MADLLLLVSIICAVAPMLAFVYLMWWLDRYDREPVWLVALTFAWGALGAVTIAGVLNTVAFVVLDSLFGTATAWQVSLSLVAPLTEEPAKALVLLVVIWSRHFDNATDGFVYGAITGLGFAATENFMYFASAIDGGVGAWFLVVVTRTLYSALMHGMATSIVGAALGVARFGGVGARLLAPPLGLALAMAAHALWNTLATLDGFGMAAPGTFLAADLLLFPLEFFGAFLVFQACLWHEKRVLGRELALAAGQGTLPLEHVAALARFRTRIRRDWLAPGVPHHDYVRAATTLALRRHHARATRDRDALEAEIAELRVEVRRLLALGRS